MIWVIIFFYILPVLLFVDLLHASYKIAKEEGDEILVIHAIIGILAALCPVINLVFLVLVVRALEDSIDDFNILAKYSVVCRILFKKI